MFGKFFESVFTTSTASSDSFSIDPEYPSLYDDGLSNIDVNEDYVRKQLRVLDASKGRGCDEIPPIFF